MIPESLIPPVSPAAAIPKPLDQVAEKQTSPASLSILVTNGWIPWESWCLTNNLSKPQRQNHSTNISYALHTASGVMTLTAGSRLAQWNNLVCGLGFAPKLTNGELFIHALDLKKNVLPLLGVSAILIVIGFGIGMLLGAVLAGLAYAVKQEIVNQVVFALLSSWVNAYLGVVVTAAFMSFYLSLPDRNNN